MPREDIVTTRKQTDSFFLTLYYCDYSYSYATMLTLVLMAHENRA